MIINLMSDANDQLPSFEKYAKYDFSKMIVVIKYANLKIYARLVT